VSENPHPGHINPSPLTESLQLASQANSLFQSKAGDRQLTLLLGIKAVKQSALPFPKTVLERMVATAPQVLTHISEVNSVAISPDSHMF